METNLTLSNPKRRRATRGGWADLFPYYAGYPEEFATAVLNSARLRRNAYVYDPWNGSGSTTSAAAALGLRASGIDINPVMVVVARARLLPSSEWSSLRPLSRRIIQHARTLATDGEADELTAWFDSETTVHVRRLERSICEHLVEADEVDAPLDHLSALASTFYVALFSAVRSLCWKFRTSNPTWLRAATDPSQLLTYSRSEVEHRFLDAVERARSTCRAGSLTSKAGSRVRIDVADATRTRPRKNSVDLVLTSPPYCTRIDYTAATRVELAVLSRLARVTRSDLSAKMLGSIRVPKKFPRKRASWGPTAASFLTKVETHPSHASDTYYLKSHLDYFSKLFASLSQCAAALRPGGAALLVVQDSRYKGIHNDLQAVVSEMMDGLGLPLAQRSDFSFARSMRDVNSRSLSYGIDGAVRESALLFRKET